MIELFEVLRREAESQSWRGGSVFLHPSRAAGANRPAQGRGRPHPWRNARHGRVPRGEIARIEIGAVARDAAFDPPALDSRRALDCHGHLLYRSELLRHAKGHCHRCLRRRCRRGADRPGPGFVHRHAAVVASRARDRRRGHPVNPAHAHPPRSRGRHGPARAATTRGFECSCTRRARRTSSILRS